MLPCEIILRVPVKITVQVLAAGCQLSYRKFYGFFYSVEVDYFLSRLLEGDIVDFDYNPSMYGSFIKKLYMGNNSFVNNQAILLYGNVSNINLQ